MAHIPAYAKELLELRRARLVPRGEFVIVTNDWRLAKNVRACNAAALVIREGDEPDLRGCFGLKVLISMPQIDALGRGMGLFAGKGPASTVGEFLGAIRMSEHAKRHEIAALEALVAPVAQACDVARASRAAVLLHELQLRAWALSVLQIERAAAAAAAAKATA